MSACATCGSEIVGNCAVRDGERHCHGCVPPLVEQTPRETRVEKRRMVHMTGGAWL